MKKLSEYIAATMYSEHPFEDAAEYVIDDINREIKAEIEKILNAPPTSRDKEIEKIVADEKEKWESDKIKFESDPIHWTNNKRRREGLSAVRGKLNKNRTTRFHSFRPTPRVFFAIEDILDETLGNNFSNSDFYGQFVDVKEII